MAHHQIDAKNSLFYLHSAPDAPDAPTFVFINALTGTTDHWEAVIAPALREAGFGTLSYNFRGQTDSAFDPALELTPDLIIDDACALIEAVGPARPVLVGLSIGGLFAAHAILKRGGAAGLVFLNTLREMNPRIRWINDALPHIAAIGGAQMFMDVTFPLVVGPAFAEKMRPNFLKGGYAPMDPASGHLNLMRNSVAADWDLPYEDLSLPVLSITGEHDRVFRDPDVIDRLFARLPDAIREDWDDAGHMLPLEQPERLAQSLVRFGERLG